MHRLCTKLNPFGSLPIAASAASRVSTRHSPLTDSSSPLSRSSRTAASIDMTASPEADRGQTRVELVQTLWQAAVTAGAGGALLAAPAFAEVTSFVTY